MSKVFNLNDIISTEDNDYADFVAWWNEKYNDKINEDKFLQNPFTVPYILYLFYAYEIRGNINERIIKHLMKNLKPTVDYILSIIPKNFDTNVPIYYTNGYSNKQNKEIIKKSNKEANKILVQFTKRFFEAIFDTEMFTDFWAEYYEENQELPTLQMMINQAIESIIQIYIEGIKSEKMSNNNVILDENLLDDIFFELINEDEYGFIIPSDLEYDEMKEEMKTPEMKRIFKLADEVIEMTDPDGIELAKRKFARIIHSLLENSVPFPDVKVAE